MFLDAAAATPATVMAVLDTASYYRGSWHGQQVDISSEQPAQAMTAAGIITVCTVRNPSCFSAALEQNMNSIVASSRFRMAGEATIKKRGRPRKTDRPVLTAVQLQALAIDAATPWEALPAAAVATRLGVTRQAVSKWRKDPVYRERLETEVTARCANEIAARLGRKDKRRELGRQALQRLNKNKAAYVNAWVYRLWRGPVVSPLDGRTYETPEALVDHYLGNGGLPADDVEAALKRAHREAGRPDQNECQRK